MKKSYYIKDRRPSLPLLYTLMAYLILDKFHAAQWIWGAVGLLFLIIWILVIIIIFTSEGVSVLDENGKLKNK